MVAMAITLSIIVSVILTILFTGFIGVIFAKDTVEDALIVSWLLASVGFGVTITYIWAKGVGLY